MLFTFSTHCHLRDVSITKIWIYSRLVQIINIVLIPPSIFNYSADE